MTINEVCVEVKAIVLECGTECDRLKADYDSIGDEALTAWVESLRRYRHVNEILHKIAVMIEEESEE